MTEEEAKMLAQAICDEQDQREWDSKLIHTQKEIQRRSKVQRRKQEERIQQSLSKMSGKQRTTWDIIYHVVLPVGLLIWFGLFIFNQPLLMFIFMMAVIGIIVYFRQKEVKKWKSKTWHCKNEKCDTIAYDGLIALFILVLIITEVILLWIFN